MITVLLPMYAFHAIFKQDLTFSAIVHVADKILVKTLPTLIQTNETEISTQIDAFFESKPKIDAFLKIDANAQRQEYKMAS
ncbi:MAG: hypothetical protein IKE24_11470 [Clostridia bacterium]|nr:hypothetical protein [Clostridia bacterium]